MKSIKVFQVLRLESFALENHKNINTTTQISFAAICKKLNEVDLLEISLFASIAILQKSKIPMITYKH